jgi:hypothetical protein
MRGTKCYRLFPAIQESCTLPIPAINTFARTRQTYAEDLRLENFEWAISATHCIRHFGVTEVDLKVPIGHSVNLADFTKALKKCIRKQSERKDQ